MDLFLSRLFDGTTNGFVYALLALALVVVYRGSGTINFAQGEFALFTTYVAWWMGRHGVPALVTLACAMVIGFAMGVVAERTLIRPAEKRGHLAVLLVLLALFNALNSLDTMIWGVQSHPYGGVFPHGLNDFVKFAGVRLYWTSLGVWLTAVVLFALLSMLFTRTRLGLQMRAAADNPVSAELSGINVGRVFGLGWGIASLVGALAGVLIAPVSPAQLSSTTMLPVLVFGSAAAVLGGLDSLIGAAIGGIVLGVASTLLTGYVGLIGPSLPQTSALVVMIVILLVRPTGIFGSKSQVRV